MKEYRVTIIIKHCTFSALLMGPDFSTVKTIIEETLTGINYELVEIVEIRE